MRASEKQVGASVGKMLFSGRDAKRIQNHLDKKGGEKFQQALAKRGVTDVDTKEISKALSGEGKGHWTQSRYKRVVAALQDAGLAMTDKSASSMVLKAARNAQQELADLHPTLEQTKGRIKTSVQRRREEIAEENTAKNGGIMEQMRGAQRTANMKPESSDSEESSVRGMRDQMKQDLGLKPKIVLPKPNILSKIDTGFQA